MQKCLFGLSLMCLPFFAKAQTFGSIDTVEVSSTQIPLRIQETGRNITVISAEMIRKLPAVSIDEVLQFIPGVEVQSRGGFGVQANILMRGSTFTQVLILIDGMRLNDPLTGHFNGYIPVVKEEIERIEVLRGPAAAMYGPDAVGGLINIVTKTFAGTAELGVSGMADVAYGSHNLLMSEVGVVGATDKFSWSLAGMVNRSDGELIEGREVSSEVSLDPFRTYFDMHTVGGSFALRLKPNLTLKLRSSYDYRDFNARYFYSSIPADESTEVISQTFTTLHLEQVTQKRRSDIQLAYKYSTDVFAFNPNFPSTNTHYMNFGNFISNHLWELNSRFMIKGGVQVDYRQIVSNDRGNHSDWHAGIYAMGLYRSEGGLNLTGSLRADYDQNYDIEFLPQLNASYVMDGVVLRAAAGRSIRAADYTERYVSNNLPNLTPGRSLGNPDLLAESSWSQEAGLDVQAGAKVLLKATGFFRQSSRLIDYVPTNADVIGNVGDLQDGASYFFARNISDVNTNGVEIEVHYEERITESQSLTLVGGYTFINTTNREDVISVYIANHARHLATLTAMWRLDRFSLNVSGLYKARNERFAAGINSNLDPDYLLWNTRAGFQISDKVTASVQVQNIFDVDYQNILGAPMPGRWFIGSVGLRF